MNNQELLFNLIKKLESGEIGFSLVNNLDADKVEFCLTLNLGVDKNGAKLVKRIKVGEEIPRNMLGVRSCPYKEEWNKEFKENFYKEKGLDKCWIKDCSNKIYRTENDYKKVKFQCQDKHTRMVCLDCANKGDNK